MDVRTTILDEATRLFAARGFDGTSIQTVADAVGIRKPSLLYHFPSKDDLRLSVLERLLSHWNAKLPELLLAASLEGKDDRFERVMSALISFFVEDPDRARLLVREALDRPEVLRGLLAKHVKPWITVVAEQLEAAKAKGLVRQSADAEAYALLVTHMVVGGIAVWDTIGAALPGRANVRRKRLERELMRIVRAAIFTPRER